VKIYLAVIAPDHEETMIIGAFSSLEQAQAAHGEAGPWEFNREHGEWWQTSRKGLGYTDAEIIELTLDEARIA
jgi:hypothetical protein